jgi:hypothetical protein
MSDHKPMGDKQLDLKTIEINNDKQWRIILKSERREQYIINYVD